MQLPLFCQRFRYPLQPSLSVQKRRGKVVRLSFALFNLKKQLEIKLGREISWAEVARGSGLHRNTIEKIQGNATGRVDLDTLAALISYFRAQGLHVTPDDLFRVEEIGQAE